MHLKTSGTAPYCINLDPATVSVPFTANIDIRDTVNYKEVMSQFVMQNFTNVLVTFFYVKISIGAKRSNHDCIELVCHQVRSGSYICGEKSTSEEVRFIGHTRTN